jgi:hypothetical protein
VALALTAITPGPDRPTLAGMDNLTILLAIGQLLGLPIVIYLVASARFTLVPLGMVILLVVHFAPILLAVCHALVPRHGWTPVRSGGRRHGQRRMCPGHR